MKRNFHLCPPDSVTVELFSRSRDVNGNPTAHYLMFWDNGLTGALWQGDSFKTKRRVQVGYRDKITDGAIGLLEQNIFPGSRWTVAPDSVKEDRGGDSATFQLLRDHEAESVPVLFRAEKSGDFKGEVTAVFPTIPGTRDPGSFQVYARIGQHGSGHVHSTWYSETRPATDEESAALRRELESAPFRYKLKPVKRWIERFDAIRAETLRADTQRGIQMRAAEAEKAKEGEST